MGVTQHGATRKPSGGRIRSNRGKRSFDAGSAPTLTKIGTQKKKTKRIMSGKRKETLLKADIVNVYNPKEKKYQKAKIKIVTENKANRHYVRRNILTKGAIIETDLGKAVITGRPGQEGTINAKLIL